MKLQLLDDAKLVSAYINGCEEAFGVLLKRHKSKVFTTIYFVVRDRDLAEDLMQDVFIKAIQTLKGGRYNEDGKFKSWICRIAQNLAIDVYRQNGRNVMISLEDKKNIENTLSYSEASIEKEKIDLDTKNKLHALIDKLPDNQKEVLMMRHFAGLSFKEIAEETGVSINTALGRMRYALLNLRKELENENYAYDKNFYPE